MSKLYIISDTHINHGKIATYCARPADFTERIIRNCQQILHPDDFVIHVGDVFIGGVDDWDAVRARMMIGNWTLVRGNHDWDKGPLWWIKHGFASCVDSCIVRGVYFTHKPTDVLPKGANLNVHGHLHNIWDGFHPEGDVDPFDEAHTISRLGRLPQPFNRLFAIEYTNYMPVEFHKFINHPDKYKARGPQA